MNISFTRKILQSIARFQRDYSQPPESAIDTLNSEMDVKSDLLQVPMYPKRRSHSSSGLPEDSQQNQHPTLCKRVSSEPSIPTALSQDLLEVYPCYVPAERKRDRKQFMSCSADYFSSKSGYDSASRLTEQAKNLTPEEMHSLELDIFKPLDFYEILFERMKAKDKETATSHSGKQNDQ